MSTTPVVTPISRLPVPPVVTPISRLPVPPVDDLDSERLRTLLGGRSTAHRVAIVHRRADDSPARERALGAPSREDADVPGAAR